MPTRTLSRAEGLSLGLVLTILAALADWYFNQPVVVPPQPAPAVVTVDPQPVVVPHVVPTPAPAVAPELVIVTDTDGVRISDKAIEEVAVKLAVGTWTVVAIPAPGQKGFTRTITVSDGVKPPVVVPVPPSPPLPPGPSPPPEPVPTPAPVTLKPTAATYVYEKSDHAIPSEVLKALNRLNRERGVIATVFEHETKDGTGQVPDQYRTPLAAAKEAGLPVLVITAGEIVLKVVKDPKTEQAVMEAVPQ